MDRPGRRPTLQKARRDADRRPGWLLVSAVAFALLIATGTVATLANPALLVGPSEPVTDGSWADAYQRALDTSSPLLAPSRTVWGVIDLVVFGQGRPGVLVGRDGWLYSREEFDVVRDPAHALVRWSETIAAVSERLAEDDIELVVALVPSKAGMVPESAPAPLPEAARLRYDGLLDALHALGVVAPDLRPVLAEAEEQGAVYLRTDTHWTPHGAAAAAVAIADAVIAGTPLAAGDEPYVTETLQPEPLLGDLTAFLDLGPFAGRIGPRPDMLAQQQTRSANGPGEDLFAEVRIPVALVGTSYSADPRWNLAGALRQALGVDVHEAALSGIGPLQPLERYLESDAFVATPPEVVVWEIPERYVTLEGFVPERAAP